jgi:dihydrodipicolinate synthase/N-acetylneuraminate lyase
VKFNPNGIYTAIVTPFTSNDDFDESTFRKLVDFQIGSGIRGLLVLVTAASSSASHRRSVDALSKLQSSMSRGECPSASEL